MKLLKKILTGILVLVAVVAFLLGGFWLIQGYRENHFWKYQKTGGPVEKEFLALGPKKVREVQYPSENPEWKNFVLFYPENLEHISSLPVVIMVNGTGTPASKYKAVFRQLASWGFLVAGNEDPQTRSGKSANATIDLLIQLNEDETSPFFKKLDLNRIGITGHSQGGVGAWNAITSQPNGSRIKAAFLASPTSLYWGQDDVFGPSWKYDPAAVHIPMFQMAGTGAWDAGTATSITEPSGQGICPLWSLQETYNEMPADISKMISRQKDEDHGQTLTSCTGYRTAWFLYFLQENAEAGRAFAGADAEIFQNPDWMDTEQSETLKNRRP